MLHPRATHDDARACTRTRLSNPPGANNTKASVEFVSLSTGVYICDFVMAGESPKACGRGFESENAMLQCTHGARSSRTSEARRERLTTSSARGGSVGYDDRVSLDGNRLTYPDRNATVYSRDPLSVRPTEGFRERLRYRSLDTVARDAVPAPPYRVDPVASERYVEPRHPYYGGVAFRDMVAAGGPGPAMGRSVVYARGDGIDPVRSFRGDREQWSGMPIHQPAREAMPWDAQEPTPQKPRSRGTRVYY